MKKLIFLSVVAFSLFFTACGAKTRSERIAEMTESVRNNPVWMKDVVTKAAERNLPVDTQVVRDAEWMIDELDGLHKK